MVLKRDFNEDECIGLTQEELKLGVKYLRKYKTAGALSDIDSLRLYEMFLLGHGMSEIHKQFPQFQLGQIIMTAAIRKWGLDREKTQCTLKDRVRAKVVKSVVEQVDFLTSMLAVSTTEHMEAMIKYIQDPIKNPKPELRIQEIKDYKDVSDMLYKIVQGATPGSGSKMSPMFNALAPGPTTTLIEDKKKKKKEEAAKDIEVSFDELIEEEKVEDGKE